MFHFLQFVIAVILFVGILALFGRKLHKSKAFVTGLSVVLFVSAVCSGVVWNAIPMPTETVRIEATGESNSKSEGNIIGIKSVIVDGKKYPIEAPIEGAWYYSKDDAAYLWLNEGDERLTEPVTREITIKVPVGAGRKLVFLAGSQFGIAKVSCGDESETYDLYKKGSSVKTITIAIADSNRFYDDFVKLCRLGGYGLMIVLVLVLALYIVKCAEKEKLIRRLYLILSFVTALTFFLNVGLTKRSGETVYFLLCDFNRSFSGNFVLGIILVPMLYKAFLYCGEIYRKKFTSVRGTLCIALPAGLFAAFMVIGAAFINGKNTLRPIFDNELQILKSLFAVTGYFAVFFFGITWIFNYLDCVDIYKVSDKKRFKPVQMYLNCINRKPFTTAFVTLLILYIPYMVITYPGLLMGDASHQFPLVYDIYELDDAHPIMHTLFLKLCIKIGTILFNSSNGGLFIYSMSQFLFVITVVSFIIKLFVSCNILSNISILLILYYAFHPRIQHWMFLMTKDIMNAVFILIFITALHMIFTKKSNVYTYIALGVGDLGALLFRHDSSYVILISLILIVLMIKDYRKVMITTIVCTFGFVLLWNSTLSWLNISRKRPWNPADLNFSLGNLECIMLQQTARYIRDAGDEVTQEERDIIDAVFDYEKIVSAYQPDDKTDDIVIIGRNSATQADAEAYKKVWFEMFLKHPEIYVEATLNHKYLYLYPSVITANYYPYSYSEDNMNYLNHEINKYANKTVINLSYPDLTFREVNVRYAYQYLREYFFRMPVLNLLNTSASFFWILFIWLAYCILQKNKLAIAVMMPLLVTVLVLIAGPCNGSYSRYTYPYMLCLPIVIVLGLHNIKQEKIS